MQRPFDHVFDYVDDYWHDVLTRDNDAYIESHCERCPVCKAALAEAEKRHAALVNVPVSAAPERLIAQTLTRVAAGEAAAAKRRRLLRRVLVGAAAACLTLGVVHLYFVNLTPSPYDLTVFGQARLVPGTSGSLRVRLVHHDLGNGVQGVPVTIDLADAKGCRSVQLVTFTPDAPGTGSPRF